jgi:multicomponent Na+:H+ antiporter subunit B
MSMVSLILATAARLVQPLLLLFSFFVLIRGHNAPGGGFAGGLVAAIAFTLNVVAEDAERARQSLRVAPRTLVGVGLLIAVASGAAGLVLGDAFLHAVFFDLPLLAGGRIELSTPFLFDVGVYLTVIGVTLTIIFTLADAVADDRDEDARQASREELTDHTPWS